MTETTAKNYFEVLNNIDVSKKTEKKNGLSYLSWPWAWGELKKLHPDANYTIYENEHGWNYFTDGRTCWVKTGVTIDGLEHIEELPVMDFKNKSLPLEKVTSYDVNKTIQRSLTKAIARHGLGLYIYAGEDLPEETQVQRQQARQKKAAPKQQAKPGTMGEAAIDLYKELCERYIGEGRASDKISINACMRQAAAKFGADNPRDVPAEHMAEFVALATQMVEDEG